MNGSGFRGWRWSALRLAIVLGAGLLLARLGPFGTFDDLRPAPRYMYWVGLTLLMWLQSVAALVMLASTPARQWPRIGYLMLSAAIGAVPTAFEVAWAEMLLRVTRDLTLIDVVGIYGDVLLLSVPLLVATHLWGHKARKIPEPTPETGGTDWLIGQLPPQRRGTLLAVKSEDHYIRVYTAAGSELRHMRFSDAVAKLGGAGVQVHRSWWVASGAVRAQRREGDRIVVELLDGSAVPVSRSYVVAARQAGLIAS